MTAFLHRSIISWQGLGSLGASHIFVVLGSMLHLDVAPEKGRGEGAATHLASLGSRLLRQPTDSKIYDLQELRAKDQSHVEPLQKTGLRFRYEKNTKGNILEPSYSLVYAYERVVYGWLSG